MYADHYYKCCCLFYGGYFYCFFMYVNLLGYVFRKEQFQFNSCIFIYEHVVFIISICIIIPSLLARYVDKSKTSKKVEIYCMAKYDSVYTE